MAKPWKRTSRRGLNRMKQQIQTRYITKDEFKEYSGIDLDATLRDDGNPSNKTNAFLSRIERRVATYLNAHFFRNVDVEYKKLSDYQKEHYKYALMEQAIYELRNGEISTDSGYDPEKGEVANVDNLSKLRIAPNAKDELITCGLWNRHIGDGGNPYGWFI